MEIWQEERKVREEAKEKIIDKLKKNKEVGDAMRKKSGDIS
jgi:hypothetical protein